MLILPSTSSTKSYWGGGDKIKTNKISNKWFLFLYINTSKVSIQAICQLISYNDLSSVSFKYNRIKYPMYMYNP